MWILLLGSDFRVPQRRGELLWARLALFENFFSKT